MNLCAIPPALKRFKSNFAFVNNDMQAIQMNDW